MKGPKRQSSILVGVFFFLFDAVCGTTHRRHFVETHATLLPNPQALFNLQTRSGLLGVTGAVRSFYFLPRRNFFYCRLSNTVVTHLRYPGVPRLLFSFIAHHPGLLLVGGTAASPVGVTGAGAGLSAAVAPAAAAGVTVVVRVEGGEVHPAAPRHAAEGLPLLGTETGTAKTVIMSMVMETAGNTMMMMITGMVTMMTEMMMTMVGSRGNHYFLRARLTIWRNVFISLTSPGFEALFRLVLKLVLVLGV